MLCECLESSLHPKPAYHPVALSPENDSLSYCLATLHIRDSPWTVISFSRLIYFLVHLPTTTAGWIKWFHSIKGRKRNKTPRRHYICGGHGLCSLLKSCGEKQFTFFFQFDGCTDNVRVSRMYVFDILSCCLGEESSGFGNGTESKQKVRKQ